MTALLQRLRWVPFLALLFCAVGCFGISQNPSYFPHLVPFGDVIQTHAKPPGPSYYSNFDTQAFRLEVEPKEMVSQVGSQVILLGTVYDPENKPRRNRRLEWMLDGVGNIVEVDESGIFAGRGYKTSNKHAVSYTNYGEHRLDRGTQNRNDDVMIRPGQSWCVVSSPVEGDTHVTVYAPGIYDWQRRAISRVVRWVDVSWEFPPDATAKFGTQHNLVTKVFRFTDRKPLKGYVVRYKVLVGPPARFVPTNTQQFDAASDLLGEARAILVQDRPASGINRLGVEIIRAPDPTAPSGTGVTIATGTVSVEWLAPNVQMTHSAPPPTAIKQELVFDTTLTNTGRIESQALTVIAPLPEGLEFVSSIPPARRDLNDLVWSFPTLNVGQTQTIKATYRGQRAGPVTSTVMLTTGDGQRDQKSANTEITTPELKINLSAPAVGTVGAATSYSITVTNPGTSPLNNVEIVAQFDPGLEHAIKSQLVRQNLGTLGAGQSRNEILALTPTRPGQFSTQVKATSGGLEAVDRHVLTVQEPKLDVKIIEPPTKRFVGRPAEYRINVVNIGDVPLSNLQARFRLPVELSFVSADNGGVLQSGEVVWNLGQLQPKGSLFLNLVTQCNRTNPRAVVTVQATADGNVSRTDQAVLEIAGSPAVDISIKDDRDPIAVGQKVTYTIDVANRGSAPNNKIALVVTVPPELRFLRASARNGEQGRLDGNRVSFPLVHNLAPNGTYTWLLELEALKPGPISGLTRLAAEVTSEANLTPVRVEEPTGIFEPKAAPSGALPQAPPGTQVVPVPKEGPMMNVPNPMAPIAPSIKPVAPGATEVPMLQSVIGVPTSNPSGARMPAGPATEITMPPIAPTPTAIPPPLPK